jgi:hypothetical protein
VTFELPSGEEREIFHVLGESECLGAHGWYFDSPDVPALSHRVPDDVHHPTVVENAVRSTVPVRGTMIPSRFVIAVAWRRSLQAAPRRSTPARAGAFTVRRLDRRSPGPLPDRAAHTWRPSRW